MENKKVPKRVFINPLYKDKATVLKFTHETKGAYLLGELEVAPGGGNPMHTHAAFQETFTAVKGILGIRIRNERFYLRPGESMTVPLHTPHCFFNDDDEPITCHIKFEPGHDGFIKGLAIGYGLARDGHTNKKGIPKSLIHLALVIVLTDTKPAGLLGALFPLFKWLARKAQQNGTEQELLDRYYYESAMPVVR